MSEYLSKKDALASVNNLFSQKQTNSFNSGFEEAAQRTAASLNKFEQQWSNRNTQPVVAPQLPKIEQPSAQQTANYNRLQSLAVNNPVQTKPLASGRDFAVMPQIKPDAENEAAKNAFIADYKAKHGGSDFEAKIAYDLNNNKFLKGADALMKATNPIAAMYRTGQAVEDIANTAINGKLAEPYALGQAYIKEADKARQEFSEMTGNGFASNIALAAGDMLANAGTAGMMGVGVTPFLAATSGIQTAGEDVNNGRDVVSSVLHGVGSGGITYLTEGLGGIGQTKLGQTIISKITSAPAIKKAIETASPKVAKYLGNSIVRFIANVGEEGLEEAIEYPAQVLLENIIFDDATPFDVKEWWNNAVVGAGVGGLFGLSNLAVNKLAGASAAQPVTENTETVIEPAETVIEAKENPANPQTIGDMQGEQSTEQKIRSGLEAMRVSGLVNNNEARAVNRRTRRALNAMGNKLGVKIMFDGTLSGENGRYDPEDRTIHIALDSQDPIGVVATHEITHRLKETSPEIYKQFKQAAFDIMKSNGSYDNVMAAVAEAYADGDPSLIEDEMAAHFTRVMTEDISAFEQLAGVNRNFAQKLLDMLDDFLRKAGWGDNMNAALDSLFGEIDPKKLQNARNSWAQALQNADAQAMGSGEMQQSIETLSDGKRYVKADRQLIQGDDIAQWKKAVSNFLEFKIRRGDDITIYTADGHPLIIGEDTVGKAVYQYRDGGATKLSPEEFKRKLNAAAHVDELASVSKFKFDSEDNKNHPHDDVDGKWKYFTAYFEDFDGQYYEVVFSAKPVGNDIIYDITNFRKRKHPANTGSSSNNRGAQSRVLLNDLNITQPYGGVNNHSMKSLPLQAVPNAEREKLAIKTFGTTYRFSEAGYITPSGQLLDFSGRKQGAKGGYRTMDHREVSELFEDQIGDGYSEYMNRFIAEGNIRVMQDVGVDLGVLEPTAKQYTVLRRFIEKTIDDNEYFNLDFSAVDGRPIANREYEGRTPAKKIIDDIKYYYKNGELPYKSEMANFLYSRPLNPNATSKDMLAPLREKMEAAKKAVTPHQPLTGSRQGGESAINHIGEAGAFDDVKALLATATREQTRRKNAEKDNIATIASLEDLKRPRVNVQDVADAFTRKMVDSGERVAKIAKATGDKVIYPLFNNAKQARQTAQYNIGVAQTDIKGKRIGKSVQEIIQPIKAKGEDYWNAFQDYVYHMHNIDSMTLTTRGAAVLNSFLEELEAANPILKGITLEEAQELRRRPQYRDVAGEWINLHKRMQSITNKPVFGKSMTAEQSREIAGQYLLNHPEFEDYAAEVVGYYKNLINNNVDAGLISPKERDIL